MDKIILTGIDLYAYGGVSPAERQIGQRYRIDVELECNLHEAGTSDDLRDTVSYADAHGIVLEVARAQTFHLVESLAERIAQELLSRLVVDRVQVRVMKLLPPVDGVVAEAGVEIVREQRV